MFLWIDPWIRKLGYGLIDKDLNIVDAGILLLDQKAPTRTDQFKRMREIYSFFEEMLQQHTITAVGIEKLYFTKYNQANAEFVYGIRWALAMLLIDNNIPIYEYTPPELKKRISMNWKASKALMQRMIMKLFKLEDLPAYHDTADALGLARVVRRKTQIR